MESKLGSEVNTELSLDIKVVLTVLIKCIRNALDRGDILKARILMSSFMDTFPELKVPKHLTSLLVKDEVSTGPLSGTLISSNFRSVIKPWTSSTIEE